MKTADTLQSLEAALAAFLRTHGSEGLAIPLTPSSNRAFGDLTTTVAFALAKVLQKPPLEVAEMLAVFLSEHAIPGVAHISAQKPGYVNVTFSPAFWAALTHEVLEDASYGQNALLAGEVWAIEHTSPNPNKAMHLGHLRNNLVGMSVAHILETSGARVVYEAVDNNRGIAIAKLMWGFLSHMRKEIATPVDIAYWHEHKDAWYTPSELLILPDVFVSQCYQKGSDDAKDPALEEKIRALVVAWEAHDPLVWDLWSHVLAYSYEGRDRTLRRLGNRWDTEWHEHEHYGKGKQYVEEGLAKGIFKRLEDGAVLTDLAAYNMPDTILLKRDGTSLYITQDLALTALKKEAHHADHLVWVVGPDQSLALRQLFAVCEQLGIGALTDFTHVSYGYVGLRDGDGGFKKMSSREGTVLLIDDVIDAVRDSLLLAVLTRTEIVDKEALAEKLALAAVKFSVLKIERTQDVAFDIERSIETKGDSGIYVMYTLVRALSILKKARALGKHPVVGECAKGQEVMREVFLYPHAVMRAQQDLSPHHLAQYLLDLCARFNQWYNEEIILDGSAEEVHKLAVVAVVERVLRSGLAILNIETVEEM